MKDFRKKFSLHIHCQRQRTVFPVAGDKHIQRLFHLFQAGKAVFWITVNVRTFLRLLTGCSRINSDVARRIPGLHRDPKDRLSSLKQVEEALDMLISSHGEYVFPVAGDKHIQRLFHLFQAGKAVFWITVKARNTAGNVTVNPATACQQAQECPDVHRDPKDRLSSLKQVEEALDMLISSHGEYCPLPLTMDVQAELFPEVLH